MARSHITTACLAAIVICMGLTNSFAATFEVGDWRANPGTVFFTDDRTGDNQFTSPTTSSEQRWTIDPGADVYDQEKFERPVNNSNPSADDQGNLRAYQTYYEYLDIINGAFWNDTASDIGYFGIELFGRDEVNQSGVSSEKGFGETYRVRTSANEDFTYGYLFSTVDPEGKDNNGAWQNESTQAWVDTNGDIRTPDSPDGYDDDFVDTQDNRMASRIIGNWVEIAVAYDELGLTDEILSYLLFESNKGLTDPQNYFFSAEYAFAEAGSPYKNLGVGNLSGNVYELDTLLAVNEVPLPAALPLYGTGLGLMALFGWWRRRRAVAA